MTRKKLLYMGACIVLVLLLVGVALYFVTWTTDVEINSIMRKQTGLIFQVSK